MKQHLSHRSRLGRLLWLLLVLAACLAGMLFGRYAARRQTYTAQAIIRCHDAQAASAWDPAAVFSVSAVRAALDTLGLDVPVDTIRAGSSVTAISPETSAPAEAPAEYLVQLTLGSSFTPEITRTLLDEILNNAFTAYCERYVAVLLLPDRAALLEGQGYAPAAQAEQLAFVAEELLAQLAFCQSTYPEFRSPRTGLFLADLTDEYQFLLDTFLQVPSSIDEDVLSILYPRFASLYSSYTATLADYNAYAGAASIHLLTSITVHAKLPVWLYALLGGAGVLALGACGLALLGRLHDLAQQDKDPSEKEAPCSGSAC